jgi:hypothetical protein
MVVLFLLAVTARRLQVENAFERGAGLRKAMENHFSNRPAAPGSAASPMS